VAAFEARQALREAGQAVPAALHGGGDEVAVFVQSAALADGFLEVFDAEDVPVVEAADFEAKAVGPEVHGRQQCSVLHG
jgi:hypothetical protein